MEHLHRIELPKWWTESENTVYGYADMTPTYCCEAIPSYWVIVPAVIETYQGEADQSEFEYEGYFDKKDLTFVPFLDMADRATAMVLLGYERTYNLIEQLVNKVKVALEKTTVAFWC